MSDPSLHEKIYALIAQTLGVDAGSIKPDAQLSELSRDSIQLFELVLVCEKEFNLQASYDDLMRITTVQDVEDYLEGKLLPKPE